MAVLPPGRDLASSVSAGRRRRRRDLAGEPLLRLGGGLATVTECNEQTVTNWLQYALPIRRALGVTFSPGDSDADQVI